MSARMLWSTPVYMLEEIKILNIRISAHESRREIGIAEEDLQLPCVTKKGLTRFWSWQVLMMEEKVQILHQEHERQAEVVTETRKTGEEE